MKIANRGQKGSAIVEFTLAGIPTIFLLFSTLQLSLGMWHYFTMDSAVNVAARYAAVRGKGCTSNGNTCGTTIGAITTQLASSNMGLDSSRYNVTLTTDSGAQTSCAPLNTCFSNNTAWPPSSNNDNQVGKNVTISATYTFSAAVGMFWFRDGMVKFEPITFPATSTQQVIF